MFPTCSCKGVRRIVSKDFTTDKYLLPKGTHVTIGTMVMFRNPKYFDEPDEFRPSRWENPSEKKPMVFMPFGLGRRNCVGQS